MCTRSRSNPRKVKKPVVKKWCYTPSPESGLEVETESLAEPELTCPARCRQVQQLVRSNSDQ